MKCLTKCEYCKKFSLIIRHRVIVLPQVKIPGKSAKRMCGKCYNKAKTYFSNSVNL